MPAKRLAALAVNEIKNAFALFFSRKKIKPMASVITTAISRKRSGICVAKYNNESSGQVKRFSRISISNACFHICLYAKSTMGNSISSVYKR